MYWDAERWRYQLYCCSVAVVDKSWHEQDGQILMNEQWRLMLQGVGQRQWSPVTKSPVDVTCEMTLRVGLRSYESGRAHLHSAREAFAKTKNR
jgi:hypothetical protein